MSAAEAVFVLCLAAVAYPYVGYPALLWLWSRFRTRPVRKGDVRPALTVVVPARNEAAVIGEKVANTLAQDYPRDRLEVLVVSDGSTDGTDEIVADFEDERVRLLPCPPLGKAHALNAGAEAARGEILAFTDADMRLVPGALARLVENFADPGVGGVSARRRYRMPQGGEATDSTGTGEGLYWRYETWLKRTESRVGSVFGADGGLYALRRELFVPLEEPAQADDLAISARVPGQGYRLVFEPDAVASDEAPADARAEFRRKVRIAAHSLRALRELGSGLWRNGFHSFALVSHKLLRYLVPLFLVGAFLSNLALLGGGMLYAATFAAQALLYGLAAAGHLLRETRAGGALPLMIPYFFCFTNLAAFLGILSVLVGRREVAWATRTDGEAPP